MQKFIRILGALALIGLGVWLWTVCFPSPEKVIRKRLVALAATASFAAEDGMIARGYRAEKLAGFFAPDAEIKIEVKGVEPLHVTGRDEVTQLALLAARQLKGLKVEFLDINIVLGPDQQTAKANLTARLAVSGQRDFEIVELNFSLKKVERAWLIQQVESVKTLSRIGFAPAA
ncbi:MAG: hypothetical protein U1F65_06280 [Verrucomicrobiota bacterium]